MGQPARLRGVPLGGLAHRRITARFGFVELDQAPTRIRMRKASSFQYAGFALSRSARHNRRAAGCLWRADRCR